MRYTNQSFTANTTQAGFIPVSKDDVVMLQASGANITYFRFIYAKGNGTLYFYVGDVVQDASLINAGAALSQLSDKISRTAASDKELVVSWGMPDYSAGVEFGNVSPYTATYKCWASVNLQYSDVILYVNNRIISHNIASLPNSYNATITQFIPLDVGDVLSFSGVQVNISAPVLAIYPCKGVN